MKRISWQEEEKWFKTLMKKLWWSEMWSQQNQFIFLNVDLVETVLHTSELNKEWRRKMKKPCKRQNRLYVHYHSVSSTQANANLVSKFPLSEVTQRTLKTMTFARVKFPLFNIQKRKSNYCMLKVAYVVAVMFKMARGEIRYKRRMRLKVILDCARLGTNEVLKQKGHGSYLRFDREWKGKNGSLSNSVWTFSEKPRKNCYLYLLLFCHRLC